ncbi:MAG: CBS domain-containing protein [Deltaproteobacteria bacterium]|nr:CBS domain-containing protein [Deltaproteobacteria bacterium]
MDHNLSQSFSVSNSLRLPTHVGEVMTQTVMTLHPGDSFGDAVSLMATRHVRHSVVIDDQGFIKGVISDRDVLRALARTPDWKTKAVNEIMTHDPFVVNRLTAVADALAQLLEKRINCLPVVGEDGKVCGILTSTDLLKSYQMVLDSAR